MYAASMYEREPISKIKPILNILIKLNREKLKWLKLRKYKIALIIKEKTKKVILKVFNNWNLSGNFNLVEQF